jgi:hypothetical protein
MSFFRLSPSGYIRDWLTPSWREPTLKELLSEPIITALMDADGVDPEELKAILGWTSVQLRSRSSGSAAQRSKCAVFLRPQN